MRFFALIHNLHVRWGNTEVKANTISRIKCHIKVEVMCSVTCFSRAAFPTSFVDDVSVSFKHCKLKEKRG